MFKVLYYFLTMLIYWTFKYMSQQTI